MISEKRDFSSQPLRIRKVFKDDESTKKFTNIKCFLRYNILFSISVRIKDSKIKGKPMKVHEKII